MSELPEDFYAFLSDLESNNNKEWFDLNRKRYENNVKKPFENFVSNCIQSIQKIDDKIQISASQSIFRINKDIRFSKDKTPYKTNRSALISPYGTKDKVFPGLYFEVTAQKFSIYSGAYMLDTKQIQRVREDIVDFAPDFNAIINERQFKKYFGEIKGDKNVRVSNEFKDLVADQPLLLNKNFYVLAQYKNEDLKTENLVELITHHFKVAQPLNNFLARAIIGD